MATTPEELRRLYDPLAKHVKTLLNNDLKVICRSEGLPVTGVKAALQQRVLNRLDEAVTSGDAVRFQEVANKIRPQVRQLHASASYSSPNQHMVPGSAMSNGHRSLSAASYQISHSRLLFTESPFHRVVGPPLTNVEYLPPMSSNRNTVRTTLSLSPEQTNTLRDNPTMKTMLYCAAEDTTSQNIRRDIAFPSQIEVKVNGDLYQGSLRGIKKKTGTTRPADITSLIRKMPHYGNDVAITYAATDKKYSFIVQLVREYAVEELVERIKRGNVITAQLVIAENIVTTSTVMSLKCPLSYMRMRLPCRSTHCSHNQCFDATSFLQMQQQAPQWACPICNKVFKFENLVVDRYVQEILQKTSSSTEQITIEPNGSWRSADQTDSHAQMNGSTKRKADVFDADDDNDNDFMMISNQRANGIKHEVPTTPQLSTPVVTSRELSAGGSGSKRAKRLQDEVIDLTLSSDEDEEPIKPVKRQSVLTHGLYHRDFNHSPSSTTTPPIGSRPAPRISFGISSGQPSNTHAPQRPQAPESSEVHCNRPLELYAAKTRSGGFLSSRSHFNLRTPERACTSETWPSQGPTRGLDLCTSLPYTVMSNDGGKPPPPDPDAGMDRVAQQLYEKSITTSHAYSLTSMSSPSSPPSSTAVNTISIPPPDEEELREAVFYRLETLGYRVGLGVVESLSAQAPLPSATAPLDTIKFLCKDLWTAVFRKQIDNLKTNHRGVFVLTDNSFAPLRRCSLPAGMAEEARKRAVPFLQFPAGLLRGALSGLGMEAGVSVEVQAGGVPGVIVTIKIVGTLSG
ncbi:hypothetical protein FH972_023489 [Carpinus fangiana]|uniref:SP-RING-type domain-containing protein n=1 Tax=Carpinus fangiana TaxID=176857 RepID=A0A5N6KVQ4_9ROSI|nr:hypothetical protein FH972_023489 [Carpinus fangiana]